MEEDTWAASESTTIYEWYLDGDFWMDGFFMNDHFWVDSWCLWISKWQLMNLGDDPWMDFILINDDLWLDSAPRWPLSVLHKQTRLLSCTTCNREERLNGKIRLFMIVTLICPGEKSRFLFRHGRLPTFHGHMCDLLTEHPPHTQRSSAVGEQSFTCSYYTRFARSHRRPRTHIFCYRISNSHCVWSCGLWEPCLNNR